MSLFPVGLAIGESVVDVLAVGAGVGESLEAFGTLEGLLARVQALMLGQVMLVLESLVTIGAFVGTLVCKKNRGKNLSILFDFFSYQNAHIYAW